jgi:hypothetical protein
VEKVIGRRDGQQGVGMEVVTALQDALLGGWDYEALLVIAYLISLYRNWSLAAHYAGLALQARKGSDSPSGEAKFFLAHYLRKNAKATVDDFAHADDLLSQVADENPRDLRVHVERVALWLRWRARARTEAAFQSGARLPLEAVPEAIRSAADACEADDALVAQLYNHACYFFVDVPGPLDDRAGGYAQRYLELLEASQLRAQPKRRDWPPNVRDTVAWAQWRLNGGRLGTDEMERLAAEFDRVCRMLPPGDADAVLVNSHADEIRDALSQRSDYSS